MRKLLLIPNAGLVPEELRLDFGEISSGMIPLDAQPALYHIARRYLDDGFTLGVGACHDVADIRRQCLRWAGPSLECVEVGTTRSIGETVLRVLDSLPSLPDSLVVNFADTILGESLSGRDEVSYSVEEDTFRWTAFRFDGSREIREVYKKDSVKPAGPLPVFVGAAAFENAELFRQLLREAVTQGDGPDDPYWSALVRYHNLCPLNGRRLTHVSEWTDLGHLDTYYRAKRQRFLNRRCFNDVQVDVDRGILRKTSIHAEKLTSEIRWYLSLPEGLRHLAPRVFHFQPGDENTSVEMEFYGYPTLGDAYLHGRWNLGVWSQALRAIEHALDRMAEYPLDRPANELVDSLREMYEEKTIERLAGLADEKSFELLTGDAVTINGRACLGLAACLRSLPRVLESAGVYRDPRFNIIHGDLCLSNILYDRRTGFVRLIDPRGAFGRIHMFGDPRYDLAKLCHSFLGGYDFILNGLFEFHERDGAVTLSLDRDERHDDLAQMFESWLHRRAASSVTQIRLLESLLFLSMVPLHSDRPKSQVAFLARGLELYSAAARQSNAHVLAGEVPYATV